MSGRAIEHNTKLIPLLCMMNTVMGDVPCLTFTPTIFDLFCISPFDDLYDELDILLLVPFIPLQLSFEVVEFLLPGKLGLFFKGRGIS